MDEEDDELPSDVTDDGEQEQVATRQTKLVYESSDDAGNGEAEEAASPPVATSFTSLQIQRMALRYTGDFKLTVNTMVAFAKHIVTENGELQTKLNQYASLEKECEDRELDAKKIAFANEKVMEVVASLWPNWKFPSAKVSFFFNKFLYYGQTNLTTIKD